jgi:hypothetical protein
MSDWKTLQKVFKKQFGSELDHEAVLFLIGIQELGMVKTKFKKQEKMDLMHIALCVILEPYGFYTYTGRDADGWPHFKSLKALPFLVSKQQHRLVTEAIVTYFIKQGLIPDKDQ